MKIYTRPNQSRFPVSHQDWQVTALIDPMEFLRLTTSNPDAILKAAGKFDTRQCESWEEWPFIELDPVTGQVFGHEGRHRVAALANSHYQRVEVIIQIGPDPLRFNNDLDAMMAWEWDGHIPDFANCLTERFK